MAEYDATNQKPKNSIYEEMASLEIADVADKIKKQALDMQKRCRLVIEELGQFESRRLEQKDREKAAFGAFKGEMKTQMKELDKLAAADPTVPKIQVGVRCSNYPFYDAVWTTVKTCTCVTGIRRKLFWVPGQDTPNINGKASTTSLQHKGNSALVDIVAEDGLEWIKVSSITEKRIIWDLAKAGYTGSESDDDYADLDEDDDDPQGLLKQVEALVKASHVTRIRYQRPRILLVLPRIKAVPDLKEVAHILNQIRNMGVVVQTMEDIPLKFVPLSNVLDRLTMKRFEPISDILNIDCTILLAFASDLSHGRVEPEHWHNRALARQREMEAEKLLLPNNLWPVCGSKEMVCTREAYTRMQEIVNLLGTETEKQRAAIILAQMSYATKSRGELLQGLQKISDYSIPSTWALPIKIVDIDLSKIVSSLPPVAEKMVEKLTPINQSVFLHGWSENLTTLSSNCQVAKEFEITIEEHRVDEDTRGPDIWLSSSSRSLVGKEKQRRGLNESTGGEMPAVNGRGNRIEDDGKQ